MIKAILWDNDGILVDTEHLYYLATKQTLENHGVNLTLDDYYALFLVQAKGAWHLLAEQGYAQTEIERIRQERNDRYSHLLSAQAKVIEGVAETLATLHGNYTMGIVTSSRKDHFDLIHGSTDLLKYFDFVVTCENYVKFKPDPEPYLLAIEKTGFSKAECVAVEDSERGLSAAFAAGIRCFVIPTELTRHGDFSKAYKILNSIRGLPEELETLNQLQNVT